MKYNKTIKILLSVYSPFYSPVFLTKDILEKKGQAVHYSERDKKDDRLKLIHDNKVNIVAAAVSLHWVSQSKDREGIFHFAQINCRDGFFLVGREPCEDFRWASLDSKKVLISGRQPVTALKYAVKINGASVKPDYDDEYGTIEEMIQAFREKGIGHFIHLQGYWAQQLADEDKKRCIVKVGEDPVPEYSFSSLMASGQFIKGAQSKPFMEAYQKALKYAAEGDPAEIAKNLKCFFGHVKPAVLKSCIEQYQQLGCWRHHGRITIEHYKNVKDIFLEAKKNGDVKDFCNLSYSQVVKQV